MLRTPKHNEKVERSHRNDNEKFYDYLKFYSLEDLIKKKHIYKDQIIYKIAVLDYITLK